MEPLQTVAPRVEEPLSDEQRALATVCAHFIGVYLLAFGLVRWSATQAGAPTGFGFFEKASLLVLALALMVGTSARSGLISASQSLALGPWTLVGGAAAIHVIELAVPWPSEAVFARISWACVWIIGFPLVGPRLPKAAPLLAAVTGPLVLGVGVVLDMLTWPGMGVAVSAFAPTFIAAAAVALPMERIITQQADDRMGSYRLLRRIGAGGMGEVWTAEHRLLAFPAAIKLIRAEVLQQSGATPDDAVEERFRREAEATARLRSPHTVRLFDFGVAEDLRLFYVMELLDGVDLSTLVKRFGPVAPDRTVHILRQAALSLAEAHEQGLVHRDIKPSNILLARLGKQVDYVKVLDFGLVTETRTVSDVVQGTPAFLSPEACLGQPVDHRSDLYALGCVGAWLLTGRLLFDGSLEEMLEGHAHGEPVLDESRAEFGIPEPLRAVLLDCLAKDPAARPQDAMELLVRLDACDCGDWSEGRARTWWQTHLPPGSQTP